MKVIKLLDIQNTEREVRCPKGGFVSFRFLLERDLMGFSLHRTEIPVGETQHWHYKHHLEACYCIAGKGELRNLATYEPYFIEPDTLYVLDNHDDHKFTAFEPVVLLSIFNPPVVGTEVHGADGSYCNPNEVIHE